MNLFGRDYGHGTQSDANKIKKDFFFNLNFMFSKKATKIDKNLHLDAT